MQPFRVHSGIVAPLDRANVDTDAIIPKQFLKSIRRSGFGPNLFDAWRFLDPGEPGKDAASRRPNPEFVLNQPRYRDASILLARRNFGCGSSREHAPWALGDYGFRALVAPSFADIFYNNCFKNGILPIVLPQEDVDKLMDDAERGSNAIISVDLEKQEVRGPDGGCLKFDVDPFRKQCLLNGWDDIGLTLRHADEIRAFEARHLDEQPWL
jgi:3-isopropylmalate/(R)-2-methylmalate dehydratase small subunit